MPNVAVFCYDVATPDKAGRRRLQRVAKFLERFGVRVQYSVFEVRLNEASVAIVREGVLRLMDTRQDSLRVYHVAEESLDTVQRLGKQPECEFLGQTVIL
mgnify:CR=1 FL=1